MGAIGQFTIAIPYPVQEEAKSASRMENGILFWDTVGMQIGWWNVLLAIKEI